MAAVTFSPVYPNPLFEQRWGEIQSKLREFEKRMGVLSPSHLSIVEFNKPPSALAHRKVICLPSWFLIKPEDIPAHLRMGDLSSREFQNAFSHWFNGKMTELGLTSICRPTDLGALQCLIRLLKRPDRFEKTKEFLLGHELAHLFYSQRANLQKEKELLSFNGAFVGICMFYAATLISPVVYLGLTLTVAGLGIILLSGGIYTWLYLPGAFSFLSLIEQEKKADLDAAEVLGDVKGGIHYLKTQLSHNLAVRHHFSEGARGIDEQGNNRDDKDHPPYSERISYLKRWRLEH